MTERTQAEESIFLAALERATPEERAAYVEEACGARSDLRQRVEELLRCHGESEGPLDTPPRDRSPTIDHPITEKPGIQIGPYKLLQQIGEGGMGVVFMAQQEEPVRRKVALKIIKPGMDTKEVIARFEAERQALAMMDHVNIARVLDARATESGRPYFVMELIHGVPITRYCDENHLAPRERLELFVPVCEAIQHAHQKGIIHRDIKPSNVMITLYDGKPVPKVIDFGVAKATEQTLTERTLFTQYGSMVGTLEYMSPEQAEMSALGVDTRSDIYSLGVLLYELLTGSTPLTGKRVKEAAYAEILRMIKEEEPPKPSTRLSDSGEALASISAQRRMEPARLTKLFRGDVDWIVMKTLEKDRNRRYETANGLAMDVQRYLSDEPVLACPPSAMYRFRKFTRRNKRALASAALLGVMLLLGVVLLLVNNIQIKHEQERTGAQKSRAETALGEAKENLELADENLGLALEALDEVYMKEIEKRVLLKGELTSADREFLQKGLQFYEQFGKRNSAHVGLQGATAKANRRAGYLQLELGQWQEAGVHFRKAIPLLEKLVGESPKPNCTFAAP
ncbi:MAG: serine/threonine protein kinase [Thermoguttaceae bacterium]